MTYREFRDNLADTLNRIEYQGEAVTVTRRDKPVAQVVPINTLAMNAAELDLISDALRELDYKLRDDITKTTNIDEKNRIRRRIEDIEALNGRNNDLYHREEVTPPGYRED